MTSPEPSPVPAYGVVTCGKLAPGPFADELGPCREDPGHDGACSWPMMGGRVTVRLSSEPFDIGSDPVVLKYRAQLRTSARVSLVMVLVTAVCAGWSVVRVLTGG